MKKPIFTVTIFCMALSAALLGGCGSKKSDVQATSEVSESQSESQTQESVVALVESAPNGAAEDSTPSGTGDPQELRKNMVSAGSLTVDGDMTKYDCNKFSTSFYSDDFTVDDESEEDVVTFYYMGDAVHEPYVRVEYTEDASAGELKDDIRLLDGKHVLETTSQMEMTSKLVTAMAVEKVADDGVTDYYAYYVFEYGKGCVQITAVTYYGEDENSTTGISDAIAMIFDYMAFKEE